MSNSNWGGDGKPDIGHWIFRVAIMAIGFLAVIWISQLGDHRDATRNAAYYAANTKNQIAAECVVPSEYAKCTREIKEAARSGQRDEYDLYSQQTMALWTGVMGAMAVIGVAMSGVGVYLIWRTWDATREAARSSRKTLQSYIAKERAVLFTEGCLDAKDDDDREGVIIRIRNDGAAYGKVVSTTWQFSEKSDWIENPKNKSSKVTRILAGKDGTSPFIPFEHDKMMGDTVYLIGVLTYETLEDERFETPFCFLFERRDENIFGRTDPFWGRAPHRAGGMPDHT